MDRGGRWGEGQRPQLHGAYVAVAGQPHEAKLFDPEKLHQCGRTDTGAPCTHTSPRPRSAASSERHCKQSTRVACWRSYGSYRNAFTPRAALKAVDPSRASAAPCQATSMPALADSRRACLRRSRATAVAAASRPSGPGTMNLRTREALALTCPYLVRILSSSRPVNTAAQDKTCSSLCPARQRRARPVLAAAHAKPRWPDRAPRLGSSRGAAAA